MGDIVLFNNKIFMELIFHKKRSIKFYEVPLKYLLTNLNQISYTKN